MAEVIEKAAPLDDVMLAMDVVDTLRHREHLVRRELNEKDREKALIARLREIYAGQGIDVPDAVLVEGVNALRDNRARQRDGESGRAPTSTEPRGSPVSPPLCWRLALAGSPIAGPSSGRSSARPRRCASK